MQIFLIFVLLQYIWSIHFWFLLYHHVLKSSPIARLNIYFSIILSAIFIFIFFNITFNHPGSYLCMKCALWLLWIFYKKCEPTSLWPFPLLFTTSQEIPTEFEELPSIEVKKRELGREWRKKTGDQGQIFAVKSQVEKSLEFLHLLNEQVGQDHLWGSLSGTCHRIWGIWGQTASLTSSSWNESGAH